MISTSIIILQLGVAFAFIWTGVLIFRDVSSWAGILRSSWVAPYLPSSPENTMRFTAVFDVVVGIWLLTGLWLWLAALVAAIHLIQVLLITGIMAPSYRDVSIIATSIALVLLDAPEQVITWFQNTL